MEKFTSILCLLFVSSKKDPIYGVSSEKGRLLFRECCTVLYSTVQYCTVQYSTVCTVLYSTVLNV